jgi:endonuclease/exonuclease/phosphatase family metal-dependent hydrolase
VGFLRLEPIEHDLAPHYEALRAVANRRALERSELWARIRGEVARVVSAVERGDAAPTLSADRALRIAAWNVRRGARFDAVLGALRGNAVLGRADVLLLTEIDCGLGRSGNRNVARELAEALGMSYAFAPSYLTLEDDWGENAGGVPNTTALAGTAILSRAAIRWAEGVPMPVLRDKFSSSERRLGGKRALLVELGTAHGPVLVAACHLDSNASPRQRVGQLAAVIDRLDRRAGAIASGHPAVVPAVVGGDFNASTHDLSSAGAAVLDALGKLLGRGLRRTIEGYMAPEQGDERPLFDLLAARGFSCNGFNDRAQPTYHYDFCDPYALEKLRRVGGRLLVALVRRLLRPWQGCLPARLDWLAGRGLRALSAAVVPPPGGGADAASDHAAVVCDAAP